MALLECVLGRFGVQRSLRCDVTRSKTPSKTAKNKEKRYNRLITKVLTQNRVKSLIFAFLRARESLIENIQF